MPLSCWSPECAFVDLLEGGMAENQQSDKETYPLQRSTTLQLSDIVQKLAACTARNLLSAGRRIHIWDTHLNASESPGDTFDEYFIHRDGPFITGDWSYSNNVFTSTISNRIHSAVLTTSRLFCSSAPWGTKGRCSEGAKQWQGEKREMARHSRSPGL